MKNDELREEELEQIEEEVEDTDEVDETEGSEEETQKEPDWKAEALKWRAIANRNKKKVEAPVETTTSSSISREEVVLIAKGYSEEDVEQLNIIAKGSNISTKEAMEHPLFKTYIEKKDADKRAKKAQLGASKGSTFHKPKTLAGLNEKDHKQAWREKMGLE